MANIVAVIDSIRKIMREDRGLSGDAQRIEQLGWMLFLKIISDKDIELEILDETGEYESVIPEKFRWTNWASDNEGVSGDDLLMFVDSNTDGDLGLFATLSNLTSKNNPGRATLVKEVFDGTNNYMKSGYQMRKVINKLNEIDFNKSDDKHVFGDIYESILQWLRDAGNKGEYYTPRAVTQLMTQMTDPKLGEKVLDPAAGTGGFLTAAINHVREKYVKTDKDEHKLQANIVGWELKPVAFVLGLTNLILHEMDVPNYNYKDSLKTEYNAISNKDRVDVILANPPFGASIADGVETNFPSTYRCKESSDLFVILMLQLLKSNGRSAIVLPDGSITGTTNQSGDLSIKGRILKKLLTDCNLHTIVRLPDTTFFPAKISTNLLFFEKGSKTKDIWYYEHKLPKGQKSYSKTKPIQFNEFKPIIKWWNKRTENEQAWKVDLEDLKDWDLDIKNPTVSKIELGDPREHITTFKDNEIKFDNILDEIINELRLNDNETLNEIQKNHKYLFKKKEVVEEVKQSILQFAIQGNLTVNWREQNSDTESVSILLQHIKLEQEQLIQDKKIRKERAFQAITEDDIPFVLPSKWKWCRLGELGITQTGTTPPKNDSTNYGDYIPFIQPSNIEPNGLNFECISLTEKGLRKGRLIKKKSNLMVCIGGSSGKTCYNERDVSCNQQINTITGFNGINYKYLDICLKSPHFYSSVWSTIKQGSTPILNKGKWSNLLIPIAPVKEQKAIIEKVECLMHKCQALVEVINSSEDNAKMLMKAVLKEAFEGKKEKVIF